MRGMKGGQRLSSTADKRRARRALRAIKVWRTAKGLGQDDVILSIGLGITPSAYGAWERGKNYPTVEHLSQMTDYAARQGIGI